MNRALQPPMTTHSTRRDPLWCVSSNLNVKQDYETEKKEQVIYPDYDEDLDRDNRDSNNENRTPQKQIKIMALSILHQT